MKIKTWWEAADVYKGKVSQILADNSPQFASVQYSPSVWDQTPKRPDGLRMAGADITLLHEIMKIRYMKLQKRDQFPCLNQV